MVRFASLFNMSERTVTFLSGRRYSIDTLRSLGAGELLNSMCEFSEKLAALRLDPDEMSLFTAVVLVSAGKPRRGGVPSSPPCAALTPSLPSRSVGDPGPGLGGGAAGQADSGAAEPGDAEPRRGVGHHLHQTAAETSRAALAQQHALGGAAVLQGAPIKTSYRGLRSLLPTFTRTCLSPRPPLVFDQPPSCPECMKSCFFTLLRQTGPPRPPACAVSIDLALLVAHKHTSVGRIVFSVAETETRTSAALRNNRTRIGFLQKSR